MDWGVGSELRQVDYWGLIGRLDLLGWETEGAVYEWDNFNFACLNGPDAIVIAFSALGWLGIVVEFVLVRLYAFDHLNLSESLKRCIGLMIALSLFKQRSLLRETVGLGLLFRILLGQTFGEQFLAFNHALSLHVPSHRKAIAVLSSFLSPCAPGSSFRFPSAAIVAGQTFELTLEIHISGCYGGSDGPCLLQKLLTGGFGLWLVG